MAEKVRHITMQFSMAVEDEPKEGLALRAYMFARTGRLLASGPFVKGNITLKGEMGGRKDLRLFIAPAPPEGEGEVQPTLAMMKHLQAYEPVWAPVTGTGKITLPDLPALLWPKWLKRCRVRGKVVVPSLVGGVWEDIPLPHARVHICEVDPRWLLLKRIPNIHIFKLRDDLLKILDRKWIPLPDPIPDPEPDPWRLDLGRLELAGGLAFSNAVKKGLEARPEAPMAMSLELTARTLEAAISSASRMKLFSSNSLEVRNILIENLEAVWPVLCHWHWHWPWLWPLLHSWERKVVQADAQGLFDTSITYCVFGDHPDLYFWVDYCIDGTWTTVYKPSLRFNTWWNYPCGTEVTLSVTDPRVYGSSGGADLPTGSVLVERFGNVWLGQIRPEGTTAPMPLGLTSSLSPMSHAFGDVLCPHVEFSPNLDATHFRWSYQHVKEDGSPLNVDEPWHIIAAPLSRIYMEILNVGDHEVWRRASVALGPVGSGDQAAFLLPPRNPPVNPGQMDAWWDQCRNNEASAFFATTLAYANPSTEAGWVKLRLELFGDGPGGLHRVSPSGGFQIPPSDYTGEGDMESSPAGPAYLENLHDALCPTADPVQVFVLKLRLDNRPTRANIIPAAVPGSVTGCTGILSYAGNPGVSLSFEAEHPGGFGAFSFDVRLGHLTHQSPAQSKGVVGLNGSNGFNLSGGDYRKTVPALTLLTHNHLLDGCICPDGLASNTLCPVGTRHAPLCVVDSGAFSEALSVHAAITNGYERLWYLDRYDHAGFALVKRES